MKNKKRLFLLMLLCVITMTTKAQGSESTNYYRNWYVGVEAGVPFGISTLSSFGADKTRAGFDAGVFGGYRFSSALSLELSAKWGKTNMSARQCCIDEGYWLGSDGVLYTAPVLGMEGFDYTDLKSSISLQRYAVRLNVNILGFFNATKQSRWTLDLVPELSLIGTKATVKTVSTDAEVQKGDSQWNFGLGGNVQLGYRITDKIGVGIYTGLTKLTGSRFDGVPECPHEDNYLWESGIKLSYNFSK